MQQGVTIFQRRIVIGAVLCALAFSLVVIRLVHVTLLQSYGAATGGPPSVEARADLTDRNGELLARDLPVKDLYARPHAFWDRAEAARDLASATGADAGRLLRGFNTAKHPYVLVARRITPDQEAAVMHLGLPGLEFEPAAKLLLVFGASLAKLLLDRMCRLAACQSALNVEATRGIARVCQ